MRADCMHLALVLLRQWRSIVTSVDLSSLVLFASFHAFGEFGGVKLIKPKSLFCNKFKVNFLMDYKQALWAVYPCSELYPCSLILIVHNLRQMFVKCSNNAHVSPGP